MRESCEKEGRKIRIAARGSFIEIRSLVAQAFKEKSTSMVKYKILNKELGKLVESLGITGALDQAINVTSDDRAGGTWQLGSTVQGVIETVPAPTD